MVNELKTEPSLADLDEQVRALHAKTNLMLSAICFLLAPQGRLDSLGGLFEQEHLTLARWVAPEIHKFIADMTAELEARK